MKRSFLDAFKTSLDLGNSIQDLPVKLKSLYSDKKLQEVLHLRNSDNLGIDSGLFPGDENQVLFLDRGIAC